MRRLLAAAVITGASLGGVGCGGAADSGGAAAAAAPAPAKKRKIDLVVVNRSGVALDQVGIQFTGARVSFDEMDRGETEKVTLADGLEPRSMTMTWVAASGGARNSSTLTAPAGAGTVVITIDSSQRATLTTR